MSASFKADLVASVKHGSGFQPAAPAARSPLTVAENHYIEGVTSVIQSKPFDCAAGHFGRTCHYNSRKREMGGWMRFARMRGSIQSGAHTEGWFDVGRQQYMPHLQQAEQPAATDLDH